MGSDSSPTRAHGPDGARCPSTSGGSGVALGRISGVTSTGTRPSQVPGALGWGYFLAAFFLRSAQ